MELAPYVQWKFGPFDLEGELRYIWGKIDRDGAATDIDRKGYSFYLMGKYTMGAFYGGLEFAYMTGDDPNTTDKKLYRLGSSIKGFSAQKIILPIRTRDCSLTVFVRRVYSNC